MHAAADTHTANNYDRAYIDSVNALPTPLDFAAAQTFVRNWSGSYDSLQIVLEFASNSGEGGYARLNDREWFQLLGRFWDSFTNVEQHLEELFEGPFFELADRRYYDHNLGLSRREIRKRENWRKDCIAAMMDANEQAVYKGLPDELTLYRGCYQNNRMGLSWTLDRSAVEFPTSAPEQEESSALVLTAIASKRDIVAVKGKEIIAWNPRIVSEEVLDVGVSA